MLKSRVLYLEFIVTTQVILDCEATCGPSVCGIYLTRITRILLIARGNDPTRTINGNYLGCSRLRGNVWTFGLRYLFEHESYESY